MQNSLDAICIKNKTDIIDKTNFFVVTAIIRGFPYDIEQYDTYDEACDAIKSLVDELGELP
jgi:hypothetical protein